MEKQEITIKPAGDRAISICLGNRISPVINNKVRYTAAFLDSEKSHALGIVDVIPSYTSVLVLYQPEKISYAELTSRVRTGLDQMSAAAATAKLIEIPCCYSSRFAWDLTDVAIHTSLSPKEVVELHSSVDYRVYMLGFLPGFTYLGGMDHRLETPRLKTPRVKIPKGAVGIGGKQTGIYPLDSPGGWRLIGSTPLDLYDPHRAQPILCQAGDYIRFIPISTCEYYDIRHDISTGNYQMKVQTIRLNGMQTA